MAAEKPKVAPAVTRRCIPLMASLATGLALFALAPQAAFAASPGVAHGKAQVHRAHKAPFNATLATGPITATDTPSKCVEDSGDSSANDTPVVLWDCNGTPAETWSIQDDGTIQINGKCLDVSHEHKFNGVAVEIWTCTGKSNQQWQASGGMLVNPASGKCLDDPRYNTTNGIQLILFTCHDGTNQAWTLP